MNTPNKLTILRIVLVPVFMALLMINPEDPVFISFALGVFAIASLTDTLDGQIARKQNIVTNFGKFMDPLADKMLTTAAFLALVYLQRASVWAVMLILTREFIVSGIRLVAASEGIVIAASKWGKLKTVFQMVAVIASLLLLLPFCPQETGILITEILVWLSAVITVVSGAEYVIKNIDVFRDAK